MRFRLITLAVLCGLLGWSGYHVSVIRGQSEPFSEVLAAAGSEPGFFSSSDAPSENEDYRISALTVFSNVALHVKDNYVNPERINPKEMLIAALNEIERQVAEVMVEDLGQGRLKVRVMNHEKVVYIDDVESLWEINLKLREVFRFFEKYLPPQKDPRAIEYAAVNGALSTLDPHSVLLRPEAFAEMKTSTKGEFGGLGIVISVRDSKLTIISPLDNTPASRAGLLALDVISRIGDVSTVSMPIEEAVNMLRGPEGSKVTIWVERKGWPEQKRFVLTRERIKIESVEGRMLSDNVGYIKIKNFQQNTGKDLEDKLTQLQEQAGGPSKLKGLVLDLRNNPGGLLEQAIRVSDKFLTSGDIVTTVGYGNKLREPKKARWSGTEADLPIAVLVNNGSASASEIVAGALKNLDRAAIIGERTFGKGSVQVLYDFADNSALKLTIAQYLTPGGISIQNVGITPDVELRSATVKQEGIRLFYEPDGHRENSLDKHLDRASEGTNGAVEQAALKHITYLEDREEPHEEEEDAPLPKADEDFQMRLARDFLLAVGNASREKMLKAAGAFLQERERQEQRRIEEKLKALGVDWSDGPRPDATLQPKAAVELKVIGGAAPDQVQAGAEVKVEATVKNVGTAPFYQLRGVMDAENPTFKGREFPFGRLAPGEARSWTISTKIPKDAPSRTDILRLKLEAANGVRAEDATMQVITQRAPHPHFGYTFVLDDSKRGDGDGVLQAGEGVDCVVFVTNTGPGDADEVSLRLKSAASEDLFLERGRADLGKIKAGETKLGRLKFKVRKNQTAGRTGLPLELTIYDSGTSEWMEDQFSLVAEQRKSAAVTRLRTGVLTKRDDTVLLSGASDAAEVIAVAAKGARFSVSGRVGDFMRVDLADDTFAWVRAGDVRPAPRPKAPPAGKQLVFTPRRQQPTIKLDSEIGEGLIDGDKMQLSGAVSGRSLRDMYVLLNDKKVFFASGAGATDQADHADHADRNERGDRTDRPDRADGAERTDRAPRSDRGDRTESAAMGAAPAGLGGETGPYVPNPPPARAASPLRTGEWQPPNEAAATMPFKVELPLKEGLNRVLVVAREDEKVITYKNLYITRRPLAAAAVAAAPVEAAKPARKAPIQK